MANLSIPDIPWPALGGVLQLDDIKPILHLFSHTATEVGMRKETNYTAHNKEFVPELLKTLIALIAFIKGR